MTVRELIEGLEDLIKQDAKTIEMRVFDWHDGREIKKIHKTTKRVELLTFEAK
jgi:hypothetical protein